MILTFLLLLLFSNGLTVRPDTSILYSRIGLLIVFYGIISSIMSFHITYLQKGIGLYSGLFNVTCITHSFQIFILLVCGIVLLMTGFYPRKKYKGDSTSIMETLSRKTKEYTSIINKVSEQFTIIEYALIIVFVITGATLLVTSGDLGSIYLCIELQSFSLYIISAMHRNSESSTGSALTYFLLGGLSSCFILLGIALIYANSGLTNLDGIYSIISDSERYIDFSTWYKHIYIFYSFLLISVGFLFKIAAAPFHWWSPDVYDGVPTIVTAFISNLGKISILILFLELAHYTSTLIYSMLQLYSWTISLSISCFFSLIIGTILGLTQTRIKRLLAYSTISHVGFILLALIVHNIESYQAFLFYIMQYIFTNLNTFLILIGIGFTLYLYSTNISENNNLSEKSNSPIQLISQLKGYFSINPILALCLVVTMFSFVGLPPLVGFFGKQMVLTTALDNNKTLLVITAILTSVIGAVYYLWVIKTIYFDKPEYEKSYIYVQVSLSNYLAICIAILSLSVSFFILIPNEPLNLCNILASSLGDVIQFESLLFIPFIKNKSKLFKVNKKIIINKKESKFVIYVKIMLTNLLFGMIVMVFFVYVTGDMPWTLYDYDITKINCILYTVITITVNSCVNFWFLDKKLTLLEIVYCLMITLVLFVLIKYALRYFLFDLGLIELLLSIASQAFFIITADIMQTMGDTDIYPHKSSGVDIITSSLCENNVNNPNKTTVQVTGGTITTNTTRDPRMDIDFIKHETNTELVLKDTFEKRTQRSPKIDFFYIKFGNNHWINSNEFKKLVLGIEDRANIRYAQGESTITLDQLFTVKEKQIIGPFFYTFHKDWDSLFRTANHRDIVNYKLIVYKEEIRTALRRGFTPTEEQILKYLEYSKNQSFKRI